MKLSSVSGLLCLVEDLDKTVDFYEKLGFVFRKREADYATGYINWFWVEFVQRDKAESTVFKANADLEKNKAVAAGIFVQVSVPDVDEYYAGVLELGFKPSSEPRDFQWGRREFVLRDPDGYKLIFFNKIKK